MRDQVDRNLGEQPLAALMVQHALKPHDVVSASERQMTHKMVTRAMKGRRLTANSKQKVLLAINLATGRSYKMTDLFNY